MNDAVINTQVEHGGALAKACAEFGGEPGEWLDLSTGINPNPVPLPNIDRTVWARLPDEDLFERASKAAADCYGTASGVRPLAVAGTQSVIQLLPGIFGGNVAIFGPTYEEYRSRFQMAGRSVDLISDVDEISGDHRLVILINPNNPDGRIVPREAIAALAERLADRDAYLVVDEAFADLHPEESVAGLAGEIGNLVVFRSFGKFFGLAGLRLGFVLAAPAIIRKMREGQGPWAVSGPALALAHAILTNGRLCGRTKEQIVQRRSALGSVLSEAGLSITGGTQLFALVEDDRAIQLHRQLCERHILTRKFGYEPRWLRIGLCADENGDRRLSNALAEIMPSLR
ncbi:threonine-phosphate decarboxylase CobD [Hoeflea sp. TYP-13]|uniref:threonine-phosphate decarboxylase CobD n=1 Tax=Hoeflea sp. TYP-13 TaxID=3230023 RepID=UPI0034C69DB1